MKESGEQHPLPSKYHDNMNPTCWVCLRESFNASVLGIVLLGNLQGGADCSWLSYI